MYSQKKYAVLNYQICSYGQDVSVSSPESQTVLNVIHMKKIVLPLTLVFFIACSFQNNKADKNVITQKDTVLADQLIYKGQFVEVFVTKAIFHSPTSNNFLMKFIIKNTSDKAVGVDLSNYSKVIYPNQWGIYKKPYREVVDEGAIVPDTTIDKVAFLNKFSRQSLTLIKPNEAMDYYRDWNGSGEKIELTNKEEFLIISVDGQLLLTHGKEIENITLNNADERHKVVVFSYPIMHMTIPDKALVVK